MVADEDAVLGNEEIPRHQKTRDTGAHTNAAVQNEYRAVRDFQSNTSFMGQCGD